MPEENKTAGYSGGGRRNRQRLRGLMSTRVGKTAGVASIVAPVVGFIVNDLKRPNSIIKALTNKVISHLLPQRRERVEAIDITDEVEIIEDKQEQKAISELRPDEKEE